MGSCNIATVNMTYEIVVVWVGHRKLSHQVSDSQILARLQASISNGDFVGKTLHCTMRTATLRTRICTSLGLHVKCKPFS